MAASAASAPLRYGSVAAVMMALIAVSPHADAEGAGPSIGPDYASVSDVEPAAAQVEAVPEAAAPEFVRPEVAAALPPAAESAVSLKKATGRYTLLAGRGDDLGMDLVDGEATIAFGGLPDLTVSPSAGVVFLDGPVRTDLPARLYTGQLEFRWFGQIATPLFYELAFMPAVFTDGDNTGSDALRLQGRGVGYLAFSERTQLALGATYLDREDVPILPIFGLLHSPSDDLKLELVFPRPRVLKRVGQGEDGETWAYVAGELGGGSWAIERANGRDDIASYRDYRLLAGLEQRCSPDWTAAVEAGYVFGRELEFESGRGDYRPDDTFLMRLALSH